MRKLTLTLCLFLSVTVLYAGGIREERRLADEKARVSYAIGMLIASSFDLAALGLEIDYNALTEGLRAVVENEATPFSMEEAIDIVETAMFFITERVEEENRLAEETFLATNSQRPDVQTTPSGLQYVVIREGEGETPGYNSVVRVNYTGNFIDGRLFDRSTDEDGAYIPLQMVIPGWTESLMMMNVGSIYRFYMPSELAYGRYGIQGFIPPYSTLIFTIELLEILDDDVNPFDYF